jgi:hypothetical protein
MLVKMVRLTDSDSVLKKKIEDEYYRIVNDRINKRKDNTLQEVKRNTLFFLKDSPTYKSLVSGQLAFHFGFRKGQEESRLEPILNTFINSIHYIYSPFSAHGGHFSFVGFVDDFSDVLSLPEAKIQGNNKPEFSTKYPLPWLNWLLLQGDKIIEGYRIELGVLASRSGKAIMVKGGSWAVPELGGSDSNNWITELTPQGTRAISEHDRQMQKIMERMFS